MKIPILCRSCIYVEMGLERVFYIFSIILLFNGAHSRLFFPRKSKDAIRSKEDHRLKNITDTKQRPQKKINIKKLIDKVSKSKVLDELTNILTDRILRSIINTKGSIEVNSDSTEKIENDFGHSGQSQ
ncbi:uncharacterized protein LOC126780144 isoform X2 [Nymphalis io]|uniref:uncharacterized protein LOC126780144 isoform X2 n=1 Tax=Inachis io TaxID=171585 RepID=UPI00216A1E66|nr:uncharacterized protein LOC126780144 isoform X2 [Nymphalis io]